MFGWAGGARRRRPGSHDHGIYVIVTVVVACNKLWARPLITWPGSAGVLLSAGRVVPVALCGLGSTTAALPQAPKCLAVCQIVDQMSNSFCRRSYCTKTLSDLHEIVVIVIFAAG